MTTCARLALAVSLVVLLSITAAAAECAWVLWESTTTTTASKSSPLEVRRTWNILGAEETKMKCEQRRTTYMGKWLATKPAAGVKRTRIEWMDGSETMSQSSDDGSSMTDTSYAPSVCQAAQTHVQRRRTRHGRRYGNTPDLRRVT